MTAKIHFIKNTETGIQTAHSVTLTLSSGQVFNLDEVGETLRVTEVSGATLSISPVKQSMVIIK